MGGFKNKGKRAGKSPRAKSSTALNAAQAAVEAAAPDAPHDPCGDGEGLDLVPSSPVPATQDSGDLVVKRKIKKRKRNTRPMTPESLQLRGVNRKGRPTCQGGLQIEWYAELDDGTELVYPSVRTLVIGLVNAGIKLRGFEAVRTFLQRRHNGTDAQASSYKQFDGVKSITRYGSAEFNYLAGKEAALEREAVRKQWLARRAALDAEYQAAVRGRGAAAASPAAEAQAPEALPPADSSSSGEEL